MDASTLLARGALSMAIAWTAAGWAQVVSAPAAVLSHAEGSVAFAPKGEKEWSDTQARRTLQRGDRVWTDKGARAELQAGAHALRMDGQTQLGLDAVGDGGTQLSVMRGSVAASVTRLGGGENFEIGTPNLALRARQPGEYRVDVDPVAGTTRVSVLAGSAVVYGERGEMQELAAGQRVVFRDKALARAASPAFAAIDEFDKWTQARGRREPAPVAQAAPAVHPDTIARQYRELEARRQAEVKRQLEELRRLSRSQPAGAVVAQAPAQAAAPAAPIIASPAPAPVPQARPAPAAKPLARGPVPIEPRVVHVPVARAARAAAAAPTPAPAATTRAAIARKALEEQQRRSAAARRAEEERRILLAARKAEERRLAAAHKAEQDRKMALARRALEESRRAAARAAEHERKLAAARHADEERKLAQARKDRLQRLQAQAHSEEQSAREQRAQREEQARRDAQARRENERREEETRRESNERRQRQLAEQARRDQDVWLRTQQPAALPPARPLPQGIPARRVM